MYIIKLTQHHTILDVPICRLYISLYLSIYLNEKDLNVINLEIDCGMSVIV